MSIQQRIIKELIRWKLITSTIPKIMRKISKVEINVGDSIEFIIQMKIGEKDD